MLVGADVCSDSVYVKGLAMLHPCLGAMLHPCLGATGICAAHTHAHTNVQASVGVAGSIRSKCWDSDEGRTGVKC